MNFLKVFFMVLLLLAVPQIAFAEDAAPADKPAAEVKQDPSTLDQRTALAKKMHEIRPTKAQVDNAIDQVAQSQPPADRESFKTAMRSILNYKAIEKISIDAMAETYTVAELQAMVDFYSKPEAMSAALKDKVYADKVYPEIVRMLDQALMRVRTGGTSGAPGPATDPVGAPPAQ